MQRILIVDDDAGIIKLVSRALARDGYDVLEAFNGRQALEMARQQPPDLVIMDITMPEMDGYAATEKIKDTPGLESVPVIYLSGRTASEDGGRTFATGGSAFLRKPFNVNHLRDVVKLSLSAG